MVSRSTIAVVVFRFVTLLRESTWLCAGERPKNKEGILQRQELQETYLAQGHTIQDWQS